MEKGCILKIEHPLSSIEGACKVGEMIIVEKVGIYDNDVGYNSKTEGYTTFMSDINKLDEKCLIYSGYYHLKRIIMEKEKVYVFKAALKYRKGLWHRIEIKDNQTLGDFDHIMREAFNHDTGDHLSEFFSGRVWHSERFGEIEPGGNGSGAKKQIDQLGLTEGNTIEYVYDFGDDIQHVITLEKIVEPEKETAYPRITSKNKPRYRYCELCKKQGKKTIATWICIECSEEEQREMLLCEDCLEKEHEDHYADEILY